MASSRSCFLLPLLLFLASQVNAQSSSMGLLFTSPEEREYLDYLREDFLERTASQGFDIQTEEIPEIQTDSPEQNVEFHLDAIVTNRDGSHTIWLNGSPVREMDLPSEVDLVHRSGRDMLLISTSSTTYLLKPGQTVNLSTGELWESFELRPATTGTAAGSEETEETRTEVLQTQQAQPGMVTTSPIQEGQPPIPPAPQGQGVVAIQDLIEALQIIQSGGNEETSDTSQQ